MNNIEVKFNRDKGFAVVTNGKEEYKESVSLESISEILELEKDIEKSKYNLENVKYSNLEHQSIYEYMLKTVIEEDTKKLNKMKGEM